MHVRLCCVFPCACTSELRVIRFLQHILLLGFEYLNVLLLNLTQYVCAACVYVCALDLLCIKTYFRL